MRRAFIVEFQPNYVVPASPRSRTLRRMGSTSFSCDTRPRRDQLLGVSTASGQPIDWPPAVRPMSAVAFDTQGA